MSSGDARRTSYVYSCCPDPTPGIHITLQLVPRETTWHWHDVIDNYWNETASKLFNWQLYAFAWCVWCNSWFAIFHRNRNMHIAFNILCESNCVCIEIDLALWLFIWYFAVLSLQWERQRTADNIVVSVIVFIWATLKNLDWLIDWLIKNIFIKIISCSKLRSLDGVAYALQLDRYSARMSEWFWKVECRRL